LHVCWCFEITIPCEVTDTKQHEKQWNELNQIERNDVDEVDKSSALL
jgi:hypothetical protein